MDIGLFERRGKLPSGAGWNPTGLSVRLVSTPSIMSEYPWVEVRFTQAARKGRVGRASARYVMRQVMPTAITTDQGNAGWRYVGSDERERELEIVAVEIDGDGDLEPFLLASHVMPTQLRGSDQNA